VAVLPKVLGLTALLAVLLSFNYGALTLSNAALQTPAQLILVALADTLLLSYFVVSSRWTGWKEWGAIFSILYGVSYVLTALESVYLGSLLSASTTVALLLNGAITSGVFAAALVRVFDTKAVAVDRPGGRLDMRRIEWAWKIVLAGGAFLVLFILFGFVVYRPLGNLLDPVAMAKEQSIASSAALLVFPVEFIRGALLVLLAVPAVVALPYGWKETAMVVGLLMAVPVSGDLFLTTSMTFGLQVAHFAEVFGEVLVFGLLFVRILEVHSRLPSLA